MRYRVLRRAVYRRDGTSHERVVMQPGGVVHEVPESELTPAEAEGLRRMQLRHGDHNRRVVMVMFEGQARHVVIGHGVEPIDKPPPPLVPKRLPRWKDRRG